MTTVLNIARASLVRINAYDSLHTPSAEDSRDATQALNDMLWSWKTMGVDLLLQADFGVNDELSFWVPPVALTGESIAVLSYKGTWDASTNTPTLASSTGTEGYVYKVSVSGSTTLDDVTSWTAGDYAVFDGKDWLKSESSRPLNAAIIAMLAVRVADDFSVQPTQKLMSDAATGWNLITSYYIKPIKAVYDKALRNVASRTIPVTYEGF